MKNVKIVKVKKIETEPSSSFEKKVEVLGKTLSKAGYVVVDTCLGEEDMKKIASKKVINTAQPEFEGEYKLKIKGNRISLIKDGLYVSSKCLEEDIFNFSKGISNCFTKLFEELNTPIKIGDIVKIIDNEHAYTEYKTWIGEYLQFKDIVKFQYSKMPKNGLCGEVIAIDSHLQIPERVLVAIKTNDNKVYLLDIEGVKKVR